MSAARNTIDISIVLAAPDGGSNLARCLEALEAQVASCSAEILAVRGTGFRPVPSSNAGKANVRWIQSSSDAEVPNLWKAGIDASAGKVIVLLVESCTPTQGWLEEILKLSQSPARVVGGAIDLAPGLGPVESAVYFCRYSRYMPHFAPHYVEDLPGTNCAYPRETLEGLQEDMAAGFWETFVHKKMMNRGVRLLCDPAFTVNYIGPTPAVSFLRTRFAHGREFAARRAASLTQAQRILRALAFPLVALLMLGRVVGGAWTRSRHRTRLLTCLPFLALFLSAWCAGESLGYLRGRSRRSRGTADQPSRALSEAS
jgi:hypothetical protein